MPSENPKSTAQLFDISDMASAIGRIGELTGLSDGEIEEKLKPYLKGLEGALQISDESGSSAAKERGFDPCVRIIGIRAGYNMFEILLYEEQGGAEQGGVEQGGVKMKTHEVFPPITQRMEIEKKYDVQINEVPLYLLEDGDVIKLRLDVVDEMEIKVKVGGDRVTGEIISFFNGGVAAADAISAAADNPNSAPDSAHECIGKKGTVNCITRDFGTMVCGVKTGKVSGIVLRKG